MNIFNKCREIFEACGDSYTCKTFDDQLKCDAGKFFFSTLISMVAWLFYIQSDIILHQFPALAVTLRLGLTLVSAILIALKFTKRFRDRPDIMLTVMICYLDFATAVITSTAGEHVISYIGSLSLVFMISTFIPMHLNYRLPIAITSLAIFFVVGALNGLDFSDVAIRNSIKDLSVAFILSLLLSLTLDKMKHVSWQRQYKTIIDQLTGIYNRRYLDDSLKNIIKFYSRTTLSVLMVDADYFKKYNDTYGHDAGDNCLKAIALALSLSVAREEDFVARYGGEEFAVVLPNTDAKGAQVVAEQILEKVRGYKIPHKASEIADYVTISIGGVTDVVRHSQTPQDYIKAADKALYESKKNGRNRYTSN